jgi:hypothetical protein
VNIMEVKMAIDTVHNLGESGLILIFQSVGSGRALASVGNSKRRNGFAAYTKESSIMAGKKIAVFGIFPGYVEVERAADALMESGFAGDEISVLLRDDNSTQAFADQKNTKAPDKSAGLIGALLSMEIPEFRVTRFEARINEGALLLSVRCSSTVSVTRAENLLRQTGAQEIATAAEMARAAGSGERKSAASPGADSRREFSAP